MIATSLSFHLPQPWENEVFQTNQIGSLNFLVGPNGSGKSRFAKELSRSLVNSRLLGTDRLSGMEPVSTFKQYFGDPFAEGFAKNQFSTYKAGGQEGYGIDTFVLLEERMDLRIQVEATLSHLFDREIILEWNSGNLIAMARRIGSTTSYTLDRDECHGIKELLVLLTHLYDNNNQHLIIDEPELNLHPQYQSFFMHEVRKVAGNPNTNPKKKVVFLITHSPFILDLQSGDDMNAIISFDLKYTMPKQVSKLQLNLSSPNSFARRLNAHHKQLFFSDNPIFVEGILDAWFIEALMETRGVSAASAGSCIIDSGGNEEVNQYLRLCHGLGKSAHYLYDLDSMFSGKLRSCIREDQSIQGFLAAAGLGNDFTQYSGQLDRELKGVLDKLLASPLPDGLEELSRFLNRLGARSQGDKQQLAKARVAVMTAMSRHREDMVTVLSAEVVENIEGRWSQILAVLRTKNVHVLPGGTLERYLPSYTGNEYILDPDAKHRAVQYELLELGKLSTDEALAERYDDLYHAVRSLPTKAEVDVDEVLRNHLSDYIHELQRTVVNNPGWSSDEIRVRLDTLQPSRQGVFSIRNFERNSNGEFSATIDVMEMLGQPPRFIQINERTNAGMGDFEIEIVRADERGEP